jgi:ubiquinone/menaquinone biosynthesis C-methylase UbiE
MNPEEYERMHELETHYWWFVGRRALVAHLLDHALPRLNTRAPQLVDIGCGTGANLPMLREKVGPQGQVFGFDFSPLALKFARQHLETSSVSLSQGDALAMPVRDGCADIVTMLDVLEHLSDDNAALGEVHRILKPGGALVLSVPAYQHLWSAHDEALHHFRRYEKQGLAKVLRDAGFKTWRLSFAMSLMPPIAWFWRRFVLPFGPRRPADAQRHSQGALLPQVPPQVNDLLTRYVGLEGRIIPRRPLRFGTSLVVVAFRS